MKIIIFGSTGSIGQSTLSLIRILKNTQNFEILALTGNNNINQLCKDAIEFKVKRVVTANKNFISQLKEKLSSYDIEIYAGEEAILDTARMGADWIISAIVGFAGVPPTIEAVKYCKIVAVANKESLVCAGKLLIEEAGGKVNNIKDFRINKIDIRAANPNIYDKMLKKMDNF